MANFTSYNELETYIFHDSIFTSVEFCDLDMVWHVKNLNLKENNSLNTNKQAMMIKKAKVIFNDFRFIPFFHENTGLIPPITNEELIEILDENNIRFNFFFPRDTNSYDSQSGDIELILNDSLRNFSVQCKRITVEWDEYCGKAYWVR